MSKNSKNFLKLVLVGAVFGVGAIFLPPLFSSSYKAPSNNGLDGTSTSTPTEIENLPVVEVVAHVDTPEPLKAIYMTACVAGTPSWRASLKNLIETTELNAVVIDIKDYTGIISFPNNFPKANLGKGCVVSDMKEFIKELHESNIYVIGRISVFQDLSYARVFPELAVRRQSDGGVWEDYKGLTFIDVGAEPYWDFIVELSKASYEIGFDEINYDYIRYPSDGNIRDTKYAWATSTVSKPEALEKFFSHLKKNIDSTDLVTSADLFGMTTTIKDDMGIGQVLERALPYFDYISPMVYPSHYPKGWNGFANPAEHPYEVIKITMTSGVTRERAHNIAIGNFSYDSTGATTTPKSKMRPWLQDFDLGATYDASKVRAQMQAAYDVGLTSWMLWSAANRYTVEALLPE